MRVLVFYESICQVFIVNAHVVEANMRKNVQRYCFLILYNNIIFHEYMCNTCIFNCRAQINYIIEYIYFINLVNSPKNNFLNDGHSDFDTINIF